MLPAISGTGQINGSSFSGTFNENTPSGPNFVGTFFGPASPLPPEVSGLWNSEVADPQGTSNKIYLNGGFTGKVK